MAVNAEATVTLSLIDRLTGPIKRISNRIAALSKRVGFDRITSSVGNLTGRIRGLGDGLARTSMRLGAFFTLLGAGGGGAIAAAFGLAQSAADVGAEVYDMAGKLGVAAETLQEYRFAAKMSGVEAATLDKGIEKLGINAVEASKGNKTLAAAFKTLGVKVKGTKGEMRPMEAILDDTMAQLAKMEDPIKRNYLAFKLFGKSGVELTKIMSDGVDGIKAMREEARRVGNIFGDDASRAADQFGDNLDALKERFAGLKNFIGIQLLPVFNDAIKGINDWYDANQTLIKSAITDWVKDLGGFIRDLLDPASSVRQKMDEFGAAIKSTYEAAKPFVDFLGGPFKVALAVIGLWALAPAIGAILGLAAAFKSVGTAIAGVAVSTIVGLMNGTTELAGAGLSKALDASGAKNGALYGKAFALAARVAIIAGIAALTAELLQTYDPKGNLGGWTKPVDDWWRRTTGLPEKDGGVTPGEVWQGFKNLLPEWGSEKPADAIPSVGPEKISAVAADLGFGDSPVFGERDAKETEKRDAASRTSDRIEVVPGVKDPGFGALADAIKGMKFGAPMSTDQLPGKASDDVSRGTVSIPESMILHEPKQTVVNAPFSAGGVVVHVEGMTPAEAQAMIQGALRKAANDHRAAVASSLSD